MSCIERSLYVIFTCNCGVEESGTVPDNDFKVRDL